MHAIIGLGNPGSEYEGTRHNLGFRVIDAVSELLDIRLTPGNGGYLAGKEKVEAHPLLLVKPLTYMNNSGVAIAEILGRYAIEPQNLLVICDDFQLPLGCLRARRGGSDGGHNGLFSIIYHLRSEDFPRLRCGIAGESMPRGKSKMAEFVLSPFEKSEEPVVREMLQRARDASVCFVTEGLTAVMNRFNVSRSPGQDQRTM